jgi:rubrerythrin
MTAEEGRRRKFLGFQREETTGAAVYDYLARRDKNPGNRRIFQAMADDERSHAEFWRGYTGRNVKPNRSRVRFLTVMAVVFGFTFVLKLIQRNETLSGAEYDAIEASVPEAAQMKREENAHELALINMTDEERLNYVGSMVLGSTTRWWS